MAKSPGKSKTGAGRRRGRGFGEPTTVRRTPPGIAKKALGLQSAKTLAPGRTGSVGAASAKPGPTMPVAPVRPNVQAPKVSAPPIETPLVAGGMPRAPLGARSLRATPKTRR